MVLFLLVSTFIVSIDSLVCGFSLSYKKENKLLVVLGIMLTVFVMCLLANYLTLFFCGIITEKTVALGGLILMGIGLFNLFKKDKEFLANSTLLKQCVFSGFAVGLDGALLNLSLSIMGYNYLYVPVIIAVMHGLMILLGTMIADSSFLRKSKKFAFIPPLILIMLGLYKFLAFFI